ncbi:PEP-utilizing enzyme [Sporofaciens musculi]|uniref:PEP-utilizing enzyme n=1 Tax=Sporofaciens musculi TaxID=2681861 RepID=UPI0025884984|nr:PEP-utilizing enzyme [Sporofaciens musculi]
MKSVDEILQTDWGFATENYDDDFHTDIVFLRIIENEFILNSGKRHKKILAKYDGTTSQLFFSRKESSDLSEQLIELFVRNSEWRRNIHLQIRNYANELAQVFDEIDIEDIHSWNLEMIFASYKKQHTIKQHLYYWGWIAETMHASNNSIETHLKEYLVSFGVPAEKIDIVFSDLLFCPLPTVYEQEQMDIQVVIDYIRENKKDTLQMKDGMISDIKEMICNFYDKYKYLYYHGYRNRSLNIDSYFSLIQECIEKNRDTYCPTIKEQQRVSFDLCCRKYMISENIQKIFMSYAELGVSKSFRRFAELKNFYYLDAIISELSCRFSISEKIIRFMKPEELFSIPTIDEITLKKIELRTGKMLYYYNGKEELVLTDEWTINTINKLITKADINEGKIKGSIACSGVAYGTVHIVNKSTDIDKMKQIFKSGDILVSYEPNPDFIELIRKSGAIVTDQGGITCHVASVARELNIPCIVGTEFATSVLKEDDFVMVDANNGVVLVK